MVGTDGIDARVGFGVGVRHRAHDDRGMEGCDPVARSWLIWVPVIVIIMAVLIVVGLVDMMIPGGQPPIGVVRSPNPSAEG